MSSSISSSTQGNTPQTDIKNEKDLPPTKIKRSYKCTDCPHTTCNPRDHLRHRIMDHKHKIKVVECPLCLYACQYRQKLSRHLRLVHKARARADSVIEPLDPTPSNDSANSSTIDHNNNLSSYSLSNNYEYSDNRNYNQMINDVTFQLNAAISRYIVPMGGDYNQPINLAFPLLFKLLLKSVDQLVETAMEQPVQFGQ